MSSRSHLWWNKESTESTQKSPYTQDYTNIYSVCVWGGGGGGGGGGEEDAKKIKYNYFFWAERKNKSWLQKKDNCQTEFQQLSYEERCQKKSRFWNCFWKKKGLYSVRQSTVVCSKCKRNWKPCCFLFTLNTLVSKEDQWVQDGVYISRRSEKYLGAEPVHT